MPSRGMLDTVEVVRKGVEHMGLADSFARIARFWTGSTVAIDWENIGEFSQSELPEGMVLSEGGGGRKGLLRDNCPRLWPGRSLTVAVAPLAEVREQHPDLLDAVAFWFADKKSQRGALRVGVLSPDWENRAREAGHEPGVIVRAGRGDAYFGLGVVALDGEKSEFFAAPAVRISDLSQVNYLRSQKPGAAVV